MTLEQNLLAVIKGFLDSAFKIQTSDNNSACVLYFKALFACIDYILLVKGLGVPKDHDERFRLLENNIPQLYMILDKLFPAYRRTYSTTADKQTCDMVKSYVKRIVKEYAIPL